MDDFFECEDEEQLTRDDLLDAESDFVQGLQHLGLDADFSQSYLSYC